MKKLSDVLIDIEALLEIEGCYLRTEQGHDDIYPCTYLMRIHGDFESIEKVKVLDTLEEAYLILPPREQVIKSIRIARQLLDHACGILIEENKDGEQFDYVNSPTLSSAVDSMYAVAQVIEKITYQKKGGRR